MISENAARATHRRYGGDPRNVVACGRLNDRSNSKSRHAIQSTSRDIATAIERSRAKTGLAYAMRAALAKRGRR
jgi:hypothetical protein